MEQRRYEPEEFFSLLRKEFGVEIDQHCNEIIAACGHKSKLPLYDKDDLSMYRKAARSLGLGKTKGGSKCDSFAYPESHIRASETVAARLRERAVKLRKELSLKKPLERSQVEAWLDKACGMPKVGPRFSVLGYLTEDGEGAITLQWPYDYVLRTQAQARLLANKVGLDTSRTYPDIEKVPGYYNSPESRLLLEFARLWNEDRDSNGKILTYVATREKLFELKNEVKRLTDLTPWKEPQATNFILCDETPTLPYLNVNSRYTWGSSWEYGNRPSITIQIHDLNISAEDVKRAYALARNEMRAYYAGVALTPGLAATFTVATDKEPFEDPGETTRRSLSLIRALRADESADEKKERLEDKNKSFKPKTPLTDYMANTRFRGPAETTLELMKFVIENQDKPWNERFRLWNETHATHSYSSERSMAAAYARAKKRQRFIF